MGRPDAYEDEAFAERFNREARTLARLNHPNIVAVHDFGEVVISDADDENATPRTLYCFLMEYVDGANLRQMILSGQLEADQTLAIIPQICEGLQFAHDEGVVHRDIKPENVLVDRRGKVKIADFGLAKLVAQSPDDFTLTGTHQVMGTPRYMAPEQMTGSHSVDHRADIFSLGVVFYEMLTGALPMGRFEPPSKKAAIDASFDDIVHLALASDPDQRYQRASEIRLDIESIVLEQYSAISQAGGESHVPIPNPGMSTILEQQVAGTLNRFRRQPGDDSSIAPSRQSPGDRAAAQRPSQGQRGETVSPRISGKAIVGASLAPIFFMHLLALLKMGIGDGMISVVGLAVLGLPALLAPIGTTILGILSQGDIRRSNGKLKGLGLAFFDAALFPILLLDSLILLIVMVVIMGLDLLPQGADYTIFVALGISAVLCVVVDTLILHSAWRKVSPESSNSDTRDLDIGTPLSNVRFAIPQGEEIGPRVIFHFSGLGYQLTDEQPDVWVFERGQSMGGSWSMDIREYFTTLTVRSVTGHADELLVSCDWSVRMHGGWVSPVHIKKLKAEGQQLQPLLGGGEYGKMSASKSSKRRFSRKAILGVCWAAFFFVVLFPTLFIVQEGRGQVRRETNRLNLERIGKNIHIETDSGGMQTDAEGRPIGMQQNGTQPSARAVASAASGGVFLSPKWLMLFAILIGIPAAAAPFGTTILGIVAISDIRKSRGRLTGLGLAFFDAVCFPTLVANLIVVGLVALIVGPTTYDAIIILLLFGGLPLLFLLDCGVLQKMWRGVAESVDDGLSNDVASSRPHAVDPTQTNA